MTDILPWVDPIMALAKDPDLNKERGKTDALIHIINGFGLTEKRMSRYCTLAFRMLRDLEKIELKTRSWEFMSLDMNSERHFDGAEPTVKSFNSQVAAKVIQTCLEIHKTLQLVSREIDVITGVILSFTPAEYIADSGTLLTELTLRNIRIKSELNEKVSITYSKARLINMGSELERLMALETSELVATRSLDDLSADTIRSYKSFVVSLLKQLNNAVSSGDQTGTTECIAVIDDVEKMFEAINPVENREVTLNRERKLRKAAPLSPPDPACPSTPNATSFGYDPSVGFGDGSSDIECTSKSLTPQLDTSSAAISRRTSFASLSASTTLNRTTITEELPSLMNAFDDARQVEEDVKKVQMANEEVTKRARKERRPRLRKTSRASPLHSGLLSRVTSWGGNLPPRTSSWSGSLPSGEGQASRNTNGDLHKDPGIQGFHNPSFSTANSLYSISSMIKPLPHLSHIQDNNRSFLLRMGIKPQVVKTGPESDLLASHLSGSQMASRLLEQNNEDESDTTVVARGQHPLTRSSLNMMNRSGPLQNTKPHSGKEPNYELDDLVD